MSIFSEETLAVAAENLGIDSIHSEAKELVIKEVEYRARQLVDVAFKFMRKSHRSSLASSDIKHALKLLHVDNVYGFPATEKPVYQRDPADESVWYVQHKEINIDDILNQDLTECPDVALHTHWLAIRGKVPDIPENQADPLEPEEGPAEDSENAVVPAIQHSLSLEQQMFYNTVLESLQTGRNFKRLLAALSEDSSLNQVIPYFAKSIYCLLMESNELVLLDRGMKVLGALSLNCHLNVECYLHQIMPSLLSGVLRTNLLEEGHWLFRENTALLVAKVCDKFSDYYSDVKARVLKLYISTLQDEGKPACSHYGAVKGIEAFGPVSVKNLLMPVLKKYLPSILEPNLKRDTDWTMVKQGLVDCCKLTIAEDPQVYQEIAHFFGEELINS